MKVEKDRTVRFTPARLLAFKRSYLRNKADGYDTFTFARNLYSVDFAKHLIYYLRYNTDMKLQRCNLEK